MRSICDHIFWMMFSGDSPSGGAEGISRRNANRLRRSQAIGPETDKTLKSESTDGATLIFKGISQVSIDDAKEQSERRFFAAGSVCSCFLEVAWKA